MNHTQSDPIKRLKTPQTHQPRTYRRQVRSHLTPMRITVQETDLSIYADAPVTALAQETVIVQRGFLENYMRRYPEFAGRLDPWPADALAPPIVQEMIHAAQKAGVGPMAAVAGALAEQVGRQLMPVTGEVIVENGGDIFLHTRRPLTIGVFAGPSVLSLKIGLRIDTCPMPLAVCTSSGTVGHSFSMGNADAACVLSTSCALADAVATALGNRVQSPGDLQAAVDWGRNIAGVQGILLIADDKIAAWGRIDLVPI